LPPQPFPLNSNSSIITEQLQLHLSYPLLLILSQNSLFLILSISNLLPHSLQLSVTVIASVLPPTVAVVTLGDLQTMTTTVKMLSTYPDLGIIHSISISILDIFLLNNDNLNFWNRSNTVRLIDQNQNMVSSRFIFSSISMLFGGVMFWILIWSFFYCFCRLELYLLIRQFKNLKMLNLTWYVLSYNLLLFMLYCSSIELV
jgi:hypothetical protein